jgi:(p)ppGpp synthase/HD superfamily hydrolase
MIQNNILAIYILESNIIVFNGNTKVLVHDTNHLDQLINSIKKVEGISEVKRTD